MIFEFNEDKNAKLFKERSITFSQIIESIAEKGILRNIRHPNHKDYPNQWMMIVEHNNYTYCIPYVIDGEKWFLKTIYPNRKYLHLINQEEEIHD